MCFWRGRLWKLSCLLLLRLHEGFLEEEAFPGVSQHRVALAAWARVGGGRRRLGSRSRMGTVKGSSSATPHCRDIFVLAVVRAGVMAIHRPGGKQALQNPLWAMAAHPQGHDPPVSESFLSKPPPSSCPCTSANLGSHRASWQWSGGGADADCSHSSSPDLAQVPRGGRAC